jgi:hypothetical protein
MSSEVEPVTSDEAERMHREGMQHAERIDSTIREMLTEMAQKKGLLLPEPVLSQIYYDRASSDRRYALWQLSRDRGHFMVRVELCTDDMFRFFHLKALLQSRFWESEARRFGEALCKATGIRVDADRLQSDGIVSYSATWEPE